MAFKDWVGVWDGNTGESLIAPDTVLQDLPFEEQAGRIIDAHVVGAPPRLLVLYSSRQGWMLSEIEFVSGTRVRTKRLLEKGPRQIWNSHWFSSDRARLLLRSESGLTLWDTETFTLLGSLVGQTGTDGNLLVSFDALDSRVATAVHDVALKRVHAVIWEVATRRPVGQCLLNATSNGRLLPDGRALLAARGKAIVICEARADSVTRDGVTPP